MIKTKMSSSLYRLFSWHCPRANVELIEARDQQVCVQNNRLVIKIEIASACSLYQRGVCAGENTWWIEAAELSRRYGCTCYLGGGGDGGGQENSIRVERGKESRGGGRG